MERRNRSLKALKELIYIDSLDSFTKADALENDLVENFHLELDEFKTLEELFFKNINFLKKHREETRQEIIKMQKVKRFLNH
jgi:hypothetical protein